MQPKLVNTCGATYWMTAAAFGYCLFSIIIARKRLLLGNLINTSYSTSGFMITGPMSPKTVFSRSIIWLIYLFVHLFSNTWVGLYRKQFVFPSSYYQLLVSIRMQSCYTSWHQVDQTERLLRDIWLELKCNSVRSLI